MDRILCRIRLFNSQGPYICLSQTRSDHRTSISNSFLASLLLPTPR
ncbi:hypothetical protein Tco_0095066, partial [Tanacetum coccineum]